MNSANPVMEANSLQRAITFTQPTQPLEFRENVKKRPKKKNLKKSRLLRKMGADFKPDWMSIDKPANVDAPTVSDLYFVKVMLKISKFFKIYFNSEINSYR